MPPTAAAKQRILKETLSTYPEETIIILEEALLEVMQLLGFARVPLWLKALHTTSSGY